jgi:SCY1-like protein 2
VPGRFVYYKLRRVVGIYRLAVNHRKLGVTKEIIATRILPFIFPLCVENGLTTQQFSTIMNFVYDMIKTVENEQKTKLEELGAIAQEREQMLVPNILISLSLVL